MIHSTKNYLYWLFWCQWWSDHQDQEVFWGNWALEAVEASEVAEGAEVNEAAEVPMAQKITSEDFRVILDLELINWGTKIFLFGCFEKKRELTESWKPILNFSSFSVRGCWGQPMLLFWKLVDETQIPQPQEYTDTFKQSLTCIFQSVRANLKYTLCYEGPCIYFDF